MNNSNNNLMFIKYERIHSLLEKILGDYLKQTSDENIAKFILNQKKANTSGYENSLIDIPMGSLTRQIKNDYLSNPLQGIIGTIDTMDQYDGMKQISLLMLMANRQAKVYKKHKEDLQLSNSDINSIQKYKKAEGDLLKIKGQATTFLISALYLYNIDNNDPNYSFNYGHLKDSSGNDAFVIDVPYVGQICVHFGSATKMQYREQDAVDMIKSTVKYKYKSGQLSKQEAQKIFSQVNLNTVLPAYKGKLMEDVSAIPLEWVSPKIEKMRKNLKIDSSNVSETKLAKIRKELNPREAHYLAVKLGFSPQLINKLDNENYVVKSKVSANDVSKAGNSAVNQTTLEERGVAKNDEQRQINEQTKKEL